MVLNFPLSKKDSALIECCDELLLLVSDMIPGEKSGFQSSGVSGPGEEAMLSFLQAMRKICSMAFVRGCDLQSCGILCGFIQGRW